MKIWYIFLRRSWVNDSKHWKQVQCMAIQNSVVHEVFKTVDWKRGIQYSCAWEWFCRKVKMIEFPLERRQKHHNAFGYPLWSLNATKNMKRQKLKLPNFMHKNFRTVASTTFDRVRANTKNQYELVSILENQISSLIYSKIWLLSTFPIDIFCHQLRNCLKEIRTMGTYKKWKLQTGWNRKPFQDHARSSFSENFFAFENPKLVWELIL